MNPLEYLNEIIQGLIVFLLLYSAFITQTLTMFNIVVTLSGVLFGFYVKIISVFSNNE